MTASFKGILFPVDLRLRKVFHDRCIIAFHEVAELRTPRRPNSKKGSALHGTSKADVEADTALPLTRFMGSEGI